MNKKREKLLLFLLALLLFIVNYTFFDEILIEFLQDYEIGVVERIVDGDTLIINGNSTRLLGINTPEKGENGYDEAKKFLEQELLNKSVKIELTNTKTDLYGRKLGYIIFNKTNMNIKLIEQGYANLYVLEKDKYYNDLKQAWQTCLKNNKNLCERTRNKCVSCIQIKQIELDSQRIGLYNNCNFSCELTNWTLKDEGRKKFIFPKYHLKPYSYVNVIVENKTSDLINLYWQRKDYVWTKTGDSIFLRDAEKKLVLWQYINRN